MTGSVLFAVGAARARFVPDRSRVILGAEMVGVAALAGAVALGIGKLAEHLM